MQDATKEGKGDASKAFVVLNTEVDTGVGTKNEDQDNQDTLYPAPKDYTP